MHIRHKRLLASLWYLIRKPGKALKAIHRDRFENRYWEDYTVSRYNTPKGLPQVSILDLVPDFSETIYPYAFLEASATPMDVAVLKALARSMEHCDYLEIGRWRGESFMNVASVAASATSHSLAKDDMARIGFSSSMIEQDGFFIDNPATSELAKGHITRINADTQTFDFTTLTKKFDLIFIDGDHHHAAVKQDTENLFSLLKNENSLIVWHDYAESPERIRWPVFAGIMDGLPSAEHRNLYHISNTLCALYSQKPLQAAHHEFAITPDKAFAVTITGRMLDQKAQGHSLQTNCHFPSPETLQCAPECSMENRFGEHASAPGTEPEKRRAS